MKTGNSNHSNGIGVAVVDIVDDSLDSINCMFECVANNWPFKLRCLDSKIKELVLDVLHNSFNRNILVSVESMSSDYSANSRTSMQLGCFLEKCLTSSPFYAKDWHIERDTNISYSFHIPVLLEDDWLYWYWKVIRKEEDDYSFVYMGNKNTRTLLHHDVMCSHSWSMNLQGQKTWRFWPPNEAYKLCSTASNNYIPNGDIVTDPRPGYYDTDKFPRTHLAEVIECVQEEGEVVFVPSGWYHTVENTPQLNSQSVYSHLVISANRNWFNGLSVREVWKFILNELNMIRRELFHLLDRPDKTLDRNLDHTMLMSLPEWNSQCNRLLKANSAIDLKGFLELLLGHIWHWYLLRYDSLDDCKSYVQFSFLDVQISKSDCSCQNVPMELMRSQLVFSMMPSSVNFLSSYTASAVASEHMDDSDFDISYDLIIVSDMERFSDWIFPMSYWKYSLLHLESILYDILDNEDLLLCYCHIYSESDRKFIMDRITSMLEDVARLLSE